MLINITAIPHHELGPFADIGCGSLRQFHLPAHLARHPALYEWRHTGPVWRTDVDDELVRDFCGELVAAVDDLRVYADERIGLLFRDVGIAFWHYTTQHVLANYDAENWHFFVPRWRRRGGKLEITGWRELVLEGWQ